MFTLPPRPPKDYILKDVPNTQLSCPELTPDSLPRVTQSNVGKYLYPIEYEDSESVKPEFTTVHPKIIEKWANRNRALWVDDPGKNAYFLHKLHDNFKFGEAVEYDPRFQHKEKVFNRPFSFEFDCVEFHRLRKLQEKSDRERAARCQYLQKFEEAKLLRQQEKQSIKVVPCNFPPPYWWKEKPAASEKQDTQLPVYPDGANESVYNTSCLSWQEIPNYFKQSDDPCVRRKELHLVGLPFRNDGCNWYYKNYPPPVKKQRRQRFS